MVAALDIAIKKIEISKLKNISLENLPFGKVFTDHVLEADYINGEWTNVEIKPYQPLMLHPSLASLHYGQAIFEGIKAYNTDEGKPVIFRPYDNFKRFNQSAVRMCMPEVPEEIFIEGMRLLIETDKNWIPTLANHSLYIRPFMFATDEVIGVKPSETYKFMIILSPTGPYYAAPMKIYVEEKYTRAAPGGVGFAKNAGNYGGSMMATQIAKQQGYDQVLWTDAFEHKWLQEVGTMNVFFAFKNEIVTPSLEEGTILEGVTRNSAITVLKDLGYNIVERKISVDELMEQYNNGNLLEVFGTGTAATISQIKELRYKNNDIIFNIEECTIAPKLKAALDAIRTGKTADNYGWLFAI